MPSRGVLIGFGIGVVAIAIAVSAVFYMQRGAHIELKGAVLKVRTAAMDENSSVAVVDFRFANPEVYGFLETEGFGYAIRLPANSVLQDSIGYLLKRPVGRPPNEVRRYYANFSYQARSWKTPRRVVAKVEWHPGELCPRVGSIVTNLSRPAERVVDF